MVVMVSSFLYLKKWIFIATSVFSVIYLFPGIFLAMYTLLFLCKTIEHIMIIIIIFFSDNNVYQLKTQHSYICTMN